MEKLQIYFRSITWTQIKKIQDYKAVKSMYLWLLVVPFLAKLLSKVNDTLTVNIFNANITLTMGLPFSLQLFYFSAITIVVGDIFFQIKCPQILKDHPSYSHFREQELGELQLINYADELDEYEFIEEILDKGREAGGNASEAALKEAFLSLFNIAQDWNSKYRIICSVFYHIGLAFIGIVVVQNLYSVIKL
jgi:hypothetical protein